MGWGTFLGRLAVEGAFRVGMHCLTKGNSSAGGGFDFGSQDDSSTGADIVASLLMNSPGEEATESIIDAWADNLFS